MVLSAFFVWKGLAHKNSRDFSKRAPATKMMNETLTPSLDSGAAPLSSDTATDDIVLTTNSGTRVTVSGMLNELTYKDKWVSSFFFLPSTYYCSFAAATNQLKCDQIHSLLFLLFQLQCDNKKKGFALFNCIAIDDSGFSYFLADLDETCYVGRHLSYCLAIGIPQLLLHVIG